MAGARGDTTSLRKQRSHSADDARRSGQVQSPPAGPSPASGPGASGAAAKKPGEELIDEDSLILTIKSSVYLRTHWAKEALFWLLNVVTAGLLFLVCRWYPELQAGLRYVVVGSTDTTAELVLVESLDTTKTITDILALDITDLTKGTPPCRTRSPPKTPVFECWACVAWAGWQPARQLRSFLWRAAAEAVYVPRMYIWRHERFWYSDAKRTWTRRHYDMKRIFKEIHTMGAQRLLEGLDDAIMLDSSFIRFLTYGDNSLDVNAKPFPVLVMNEALKPFFAFQVAGC
jgi:hypothetical protein